MLAGFEDKSAVALCTFGYCEGPGHEPIIFEGKTTVSLDMFALNHAFIFFFYFRARLYLHEDQVPLAGMLSFNLMDMIRRK